MWKVQEMRDVMELTGDKQFLRAIVKNGYELPIGIEAYDFAQALLRNFVSPDGELRDELSYMILANGVIDKQVLSLDELSALLTLCMDTQHLWYRIGEVNTDTVFMRSFSVLTINTILYADAKNPVLAAPVIHEAKDALLQYARAERDWRGYVPHKGWAHAMAHLADALDECAQNRYMMTEDRRDILEMVRILAQLPESLYHEEDVRLATIAYHLIVTKQLDDDTMSVWLTSCQVERGPDIASWTSATNMKNFLRSLYFLLLWDNMAFPLVNQISSLLKQQDTLYVAQ